jgi:hypothetical protein
MKNLLRKIILSPVMILSSARQAAGILARALRARLKERRLQNRHKQMEREYSLGI